jgi:putative ABC transport system ATP-binding protein
MENRSTARINPFVMTLASPSRAVIALQQIQKSYGEGASITPVLHGIDLSVAPGEFLALMGPSGSGKSTLMNILGCLDVPSSGNYILEGRNVAQLSEDELAWVRSEFIGFVFQSFHLLPMTVYKNVELPLMYHSRFKPRDRKKLVTEALNLADVPQDRWDHQPNELSGGQRQRVAIARALVTKPSLILADEPTGNLDSRTGEHILQTFRDINRTLRTTLLVITHDPHVAAQADRVVHIKDGYLLHAHA